MNPRLTGIPFSLLNMNTEQMAFHLALFEDNDLEQKLKDLSSVLIEYVKSGKDRESYELFHVRAVQIFAGLEDRVRLYKESGISESQYRQLLWLSALEANEIEPALPASAGLMQKQIRQIESAMLTRYTKNHFITDLWHKFGSKNIKKEAVTFESIYREWEDSKSAEEDSIKQSVTIAAEDKKALQKTGIAGAGLLGFSGVVGLTGFAPYLLAAKLSAFIPLVSGPGLVSAVSVFSNPFISLGLLSMAGWRFYKKSGKNKKHILADELIFQLCSTDEATRQCADYSAVISEFIAETPLPDTGLPCVQKLQNAQYKLKKVLDSQKRLFSKFNEISGKDQSSEVALNTNIAAISTAELYASLSAIDQTVIDAANFAYSGEIENRPDLIEQFAEDNADAESLDGVVAHLKGYVAEKYVADQLTGQGRNVQFPQHPNEPGWDLLVDGEKYQVKCLSDASGILEHFEKYDYPVIANSELKDSIPDALLDKVMFIEDYQAPLIEALTWAAVDQSIDLSASNVPFIAVGMSAGRTIFKWKKGEYTAAEAAKSISADGIVRYLLAASAAGVGTAAGGFLLGPAGALVWGNLLPLLAQSQTVKVKFNLRNIRNGILQKIIPALNRAIKLRRDIKC